MPLKNFSQFIGASPVFEQTTLLNISAPNIAIAAGDTTKQILLKATDPKTRRPLTLKYNIQGEYGFFDFSVNLRNIKREKNGDLTAEVMPNNRMVAAAVKKLIPKESLTSDNWLMIEVPAAKINQAIAQLRQNQGAKAEIDAGQGVTISLTRTV